MAYRDLREFLDTLEKAGELIRIKDEVDWDMEVGGIIRLAAQLNAPAPFMENIKDYPGQRMVGGYFANHRKAAIAIGLDPDSDRDTILNAYHQRIMHPIKPALNGKDLSDFKDPDGKKLFVEFAKVCSEKGEGFVDYMWPKHGYEKPVPGGIPTSQQTYFSAFPP